MQKVECTCASEKKPYVKPLLANHGSVQKLTEKLSGPGYGHNNSGSNINSPGGGSWGGNWGW